MILRSNFRRSKVTFFRRSKEWSGDQKLFLIRRSNDFASFQETKSFNNNLTSWKWPWSGDRKFILTIKSLNNALKGLLIKVSISWSKFQPPEKYWQFYWNFRSPEKWHFWSPDRSFTSWKMSLSISWDSTSWSFHELTNTICNIQSIIKLKVQDCGTKALCNYEPQSRDPVWWISS